MTFLRSEPGCEPVLLRADYEAPIEVVFRAWTDPVEVMAWYCPAPARMKSARIDLRVGGRWCFELDDPQFEASSLEGTYLDVEPPNRLVFDWCHVRRGDAGHIVTMMSKVTLSLTPRSTGTRLSLRQDKLDNPEFSRGVGAGWDTSLGQLEQHLGTDT